jgi:hypothetical protein
MERPSLKLPGSHVACPLAEDTRRAAAMTSFMVECVVGKRENMWRLISIVSDGAGSNKYYNYVKRSLI